ncbi:MAG: ABC transporter substrate-binding protein [Lactobacillus sp.]|jgi:spermidine/putrescine transport system substrate-binding protein|nr:ABC transporter substrate-binding protein [Lactobacillus sp.]
MKKLVGLIGSLLLLCGLLFAGVKSLTPRHAAGGSKTLVLYNWGAYLDPALIKKFERETGYQVVYETFDSNEAMLTKIRQGGTAYDLAVPSDYTIAKMRKEHLLQPLDKSKLSNWKYLDPACLNHRFDPGNRYSVPYFWGTLGIVYNDQKIKPGQLQTWNDLWQPRYHRQILLVDSARDIMGMALASEGKSMNSTSSVQLKLAEAKLVALSPNVKAIVGDEMRMYLEQGEAAIGVTWSGEAAQMMQNNRHLRYFVPAEGSNLWFDNLVIPKNARHRQAAYAFINFMLKPENAARNAAYIGYATPNWRAKQLLSQRHQLESQLYQVDWRHLTVYRNLHQRQLQEYNDLFLNFKMSSH